MSTSNTRRLTSDEVTDLLNYLRVATKEHPADWATLYQRFAVSATITLPVTAISTTFLSPFVSLWRIQGLLEGSEITITMDLGLALFLAFNIGIDVVMIEVIEAENQVENNKLLHRDTSEAICSRFHGWK